MNWRGAAVLSMSVLLSGGGTSACSGADVGKIAAAALTTTVAVVAAAAFHAASGECWGACTHGYVCDRNRGVCVPGVDRSAGGPISLRPVATAEFCIEEDDGTTLCPDDPSTEYGAPAKQRNPGGACQGLCYVDERCRVIDGMAYCVTEDDPLYELDEE